MRKRAAFLVILTVILLTSCGNGGNEVTEESAASETTSATTVTTAETTAATTVTTEAESVSETEAEETAPKAELPVVIPSDQVYEIYPVRLIYPEKKELPMETVSFTDQMRAEDGTVIYDFSAEYPVFTLDNKTAADKINKTIESYVMDEFEKGKEFAAEKNDLYLDMAGIYGFIYKDTIRFDAPYSMWDYYDYSVNGDLLSVYLEYEGYSAGAAHGVYGPINFVFDMKTGDTVDFGSIIGDMDGFSQAVMKGIFLYYGGGSTEEYAECINNKNNIDCILNADMTYRIAVKDGAVGYFLMPYEFGSFADGIRCIRIPISEALTYFTDEGRELFGSTVSAETVPAKIIEYGGEKYPDIGDPPVFSDKELTGGDYELMGLFPEAKSLNLTDCRNIDFEKIAAMENIRRLNLNGCEFDDISPLFGSNIDYISGSGYNISKEQAEEFAAKGGRYIDSRLIRENNTEVNDE